MRGASSRWVASSLQPVLPSVLAVVVGFLGLAVAMGPGVAVDAFAAMFAGGLGDWSRLAATGDPGVVLRPLGEASVRASVLALTGLSVAVAFRVGLFNIGAQGQLVVGALHDPGPAVTGRLGEQTMRPRAP